MTVVRQQLGRVCLLATLAIIGLSAPRAAALPIQVRYDDGPNEGFHDPLLGSRRQAALEFATNYWAATLAGNVPMVVAATMDPLGGGGGNAILGSTRPATVHRDFIGAQADTLYNAALANQLAGSDLNGVDLPEIVIEFNSDVDNNTVLGSVAWYYGLDAQPGINVDFVTIALHEIGHGLGFSNQIDARSGEFLFCSPSIFDLQLTWPRFGSLVSLLGPERHVAITSGELYWRGEHVVAAHAGLAPLYAPEFYSSGSSVAHWSTALSELMSPFYQAPNRDPGLLLPALVDMGWQLSAPVTRLPTVAQTATPTATPTVVATPVLADRRSFAYVANFDDATVSVINIATRRVSNTLAVGAGPISIAESPDGRYIYVANFRDATISVIATTSDASLGSIPLAGAPTAIAVSPTTHFAYATLTDINAVGVIDLETRQLTALVATAAQPSGIAITGDGTRAFVSHFHSPTIQMIDLASNVTRAEIFSERASVGLQQVVLADSDSRGFSPSFHSRLLDVFSPISLTTFSIPLTSRRPEIPTAVVVASTRQRAYVATYDAADSSGNITQLDTGNLPLSQLPIRFSVGRVPEALALTRDESLLLSADAGSDTATILDLATARPVGTTLQVGDAPMAICVAEVPPLCFGDCDGDGSVTIREVAMAVQVALRQLPESSCPAADASGNRTITVDEIVAASRNAASTAVVSAANCTFGTAPSP